MQLLKTVFTIVGFFLSVAILSQGAIAHGEEVHPDVPVEAALRQTLNSAEFKAYGSGISECTKSVVGEDALKASASDKKLKKIDQKQMAKIQDCMKAKNMDVDIQSYYSRYKVDDNGVLSLDAKKAAELDALQAKTDPASKGVLAAQPTPFTQAPVTVLPSTPTLSVAPPPASIPPTTAAPEQKAPEITPPADKPSAKPPKKYWVTPE